MSSRYLFCVTTIIMMTLVISACGGGLATGNLQGVVIDPPKPKPTIVLTDTEGNRYDFAARTEGKTALLYFGYLNCPDICPVHLAQIAEVFDAMPSLARDIEVVFVSVDPARDSSSDIRSYLDAFDSRFVGLTGTLDELEAAQVAAGLPKARFIGEGDDYTVDHAGWVIAFAPDGLNHSIYPFGTRQSQWSNDLQALTAAKAGD